MTGKRNLPSVATALAIGYEKACDYTTFIAWFDAARSLSQA